MDIDELKNEIENIFYLGPDEDGLSQVEYPHQRLRDHHKLDWSYMETFPCEGSSSHKYTRLCSSGEGRVQTLTQNLTVSLDLFEAGLWIFVDSIAVYHENPKREGALKFYPSAILTFWSGFETFVRYSSELMIATVKDTPALVEDYLRDQESFIEPGSGEVKSRVRYRSVLDRYALLLRYGYNHEFKRGSNHWQNLEKARTLRDYYTHIDVNKARSITSSEVLDFMEAVLMAIIWPSGEVQRTLLFGIYHLYRIWADLRDITEEFVEKPLFMGLNIRHEFLFHCNFENVDTDRFPSR